MNIGQAARHTGLSAKMIRYYESIELLPPPGRSASGYRLYSAQDLGFSLEEVARLLALWQDKGRASADVKALAEGHIAKLERKIEEMSALRDTLVELANSCQGNDRPDCPILKGIEQGVGCSTSNCVHGGAK
jgi:MerR family copper efflux transcriptional regulator